MTENTEHGVLSYKNMEEYAAGEDIRITQAKGLQTYHEIISEFSAKYCSFFFNRSYQLRRQITKSPSHTILFLIL